MASSTVSLDLVRSLWRFLDFVKNLIADATVYFFLFFAELLIIFVAFLRTVDMYCFGLE